MAKDNFEKEYNNLIKECTWPYDNAIRNLNDCVGKTVKFAKFCEDKPNTAVIVFTDNTFLFLSSDYNKIDTSLTMNIPHDLNIQNLIVEAGLVLRKTITKYNKFFKDRQLKFEKDSELKELKRLLKKYKK